MRIYQVLVEQAERGWFAARALEDERVHTQGRSLDEITSNVREVALLLYGAKDVQIELVVPSAVRMAERTKARGRRKSA